MTRMTSKILKGAAWTLGAAVWTAAVLADVWDPGDNSFSTANELVHGSVQVHELGRNASGTTTRDVDFFRIGQRARSSYEVVVDGATNDIAGFNGDVVLERYASAVLTQTAEPYHEGVGYSQSLRWENTTGTSLGDASIRVASTSPCFNCPSSIASYHIRSYDTTYSIPRFNNTSTQTTILLIQNTSARLVLGNVHFWSANGVFIGSQPFGLLGKQLLVLNTASLGFAAGNSGSITVSNTGHYGDLSGKAVSLEPATGFTFDTAMTPRPR